VSQEHEPDRPNTRLVFGQRRRALKPLLVLLKTELGGKKRKKNEGGRIEDRQEEDDDHDDDDDDNEGGDWEGTKFTRYTLGRGCVVASACWSGMLAVGSVSGVGGDSASQPKSVRRGRTFENSLKANASQYTHSQQQRNSRYPTTSPSSSRATPARQKRVERVSEQCEQCERVLAVRTSSWVNKVTRECSRDGAGDGAGGATQIWPQTA
jgi:hypothetical protein